MNQKQSWESSVWLQKELKVSYVQAVSIINLIKQAIQTRERELREEVEKCKTSEKTVHTPNCLRGTDKYNHQYCQMSDEDYGFNEGLERSLSIINNK